MSLASLHRSDIKPDVSVVRQGNTSEMEFLQRFFIVCFFVIEIESEREMAFS